MQKNKMQIPVFAIIPIVLVVLSYPIYNFTVTATQKIQRQNTQGKLARVRDDFRAIFVAINSYANDNCGVNYPPDTFMRRLEDPTVPMTFEWQWERVQNCCLTTPVPYIASIPADPFNPGSYYGYCALPTQMPGQTQVSPGIRSFGVLHSPGPDRKEDLPIAQLRDLLTSNGLSSAHYDRRLYAGERRAIREMVGPYLYDATNGTFSSGDLILLIENTNNFYGFGYSSTWARKDDVKIGSNGWEGSSKDWTNGIKWCISDPLPKTDKKISSYQVSNVFYKHLEKARIIEKKNISPERLNQLRNHMGAFTSFFENPRPLNAGESAALALWQKKDRAWWLAMNDLIGLANHDGIQPKELDVNDTRALLVFYGKSQALLAAVEMADGNVKKGVARARALRQLIRTLGLSTVLGDGYTFRVESELTRMTLALEKFGQTPFSH